MKEYILRHQQKRRPIKFNQSLYVNFMQGGDETIVTFPPIVLVTSQHEVYQDTDVDELMETCAQQLGERIVNYEGTGSGWVIDELIWLDTTIWHLDPLRGESYIPLPSWIKNTKCVVNVRNQDNECFRHSLMAALYVDKVTIHRDRVNSYASFYNEDDAPDFTGLQYPLKIVDIRKFEANNPDISVNVYGAVTTKVVSAGIAISPIINPNPESETVDDNAEGDVEIMVGDDEKCEATMSGSEDESESEEEETGEDREFINDDFEDAEGESFYRQLDATLTSQAVPANADMGDDDDDDDDDENCNVEVKTLQDKDVKSRGGYIYPLRIAPEIRKDRHVNLLCIEDPDNKYMLNSFLHLH